MREYLIVRKPIETPKRVLTKDVPTNYIYFTRPLKQAKKPKSIPNIHVFELDLAFRTKRILWWLKISTLEELSKLKASELKKIRNCNISTINDIRRELKRHGITTF